MISIQDELYLVTAAHCLDDFIDTNIDTGLYIPSKSGLIPFNALFYCTKKPNGNRDKDRYDFAFAKIPPRVASELYSITYFTEKDISNRGGIKENSYMVLGYPNSKNKRIDYDKKQAIGKIFNYSAMIVSNGSEIAKELGVNPEDFIYIEFDSQYSDLSGNTINAIDPKGISGGSLIDLGNIVSTNKVCLLAGLLIEFNKKHKVMVATRMSIILNAIKQCYKI